MNYLITIVGPTAIGKTSLSLAIAAHFNCEIISCDSRQFFKEMTIGTAVPTAEELAKAPHHFIQNKSIFDNYSVGDFEKEAIAKLEELFVKNNIQIMVGGSGLYVDAVLKGMDHFPAIAQNVRTQVKNDYDNYGLSFLVQQLKDLDQEYFDKISLENPQTLQNPQRMMRFVEVCLGTGKPYSSFLTQLKKERNFTPIIIGLEADRAIINDRINRRVVAMLADGLIEEARNLAFHKDLNALQTVGYKELFAYFEQQNDLEFAIEEIKKNTRHFAKRQMTWFKRNEATKWFDFETKTKEIIGLIEGLVG